MTEGQENEICKTLKTSYKHIISLLADKKKDEKENYKLLSVFLRSLLLDKKCPLLLYYAKEKSITLRVVSYTRSQPTSLWDGCVLSIDPAALSPHWPGLIDGNLVDIETFLDTVVGVTPTRQSGEKYTPRQVIKWVCNKEGIAHFELKKPEAYESLKGFTWHSSYGDREGFLVQKLIYALSTWTAAAILFVLAQSMLLVQGKEYFSLHQNENMFPLNGLRRVAHYTMILQSFNRTLFDGSIGYSNDSINFEIQSFLGLSLFIMIPETYIEGPMCLYEICLDQDSEIRVKILAEGNRVYIALYCNSNGIIEVPIIEVNTIQWRYGVISILFERANGWILKSFYGREKRFSTSLKNYIKDDHFTIRKHSIGSDLDKRNPSCFLCNEVLLFIDNIPEFLVGQIENALWSTPFKK